MSGPGSGTDDTMAAEALGLVVLEPGSELAGRYRIVRELGRGGMGIVFVAHDREVGEDIALKVLPPAGQMRPEALERFRREVRLARRVTHRNVARTFDIGEACGMHYLTMELVEGESLAAILERDGVLEPARTVELAQQICAGLAAAHEAGVVHRDLKPANILVEQGGRVAITDFGIARSVGGDAHLTTTGEGVVGTPAFMAPEQIRGQEATARTDLYALGLILYRMLTGFDPFAADTALAAAVARLDGEPVDPREHAKIPDALAELVLACLRRSPDQRPANAIVVASALADAASIDRSPSGSTRLFAPVDPGDHGLAVLPFRHRGPPDTAYIAESLTDELIDLLSMTRGLRVCSRGATERFKDDRDPSAIGQALGVDKLVDGTLQVSGQRLRVVVRLIDAATGFQAWSDRFDCELENVFELQDEIARRVAETLRVELEQRKHVGSAPPEAVDLYLQARSFKRPYGQVTQSLALLERVIAMAPQFKPARAALADGYVTAWLLPGHRGRDFEALARAAVTHALQVAPDLAESHVVDARLAVGDGRYADAARSLSTAIRIAPTCAAAHDYLGMLQLECGRPAEGRKRVALASKLDPTLALGLIAVGRWLALQGDEAAFRRHLETTEVPSARFGLAFVELRMAGWRHDVDRLRALTARFDNAVEGAAKAASVLGHIYLGGAPPEDGDALLARSAGVQDSVRSSSFGHQLAAEVYGSFGRAEQALEHVEKATARALTDVDWIALCPALDCLREVPRFAELRGTVEQRAREVWVA
jgi:serine/threonine protein kinase/tetratricopeptide (TPR) repeat protein